MGAHTHTACMSECVRCTTIECCILRRLFSSCIPLLYVVIIIMIMCTDYRGGVLYSNVSMRCIACFVCATSNVCFAQFTSNWKNVFVATCCEIHISAKNRCVSFIHMQCGVCVCVRVNVRCTLMFTYTTHGRS